MSDPLPEFLTFEEVAEVDQALLTSQDKFLARVSLYSLRALKQIAHAEDLPVGAVTDQQIADWINQDETLHQMMGADPAFQQFFTQIVLSSLQPLQRVSQSAGVTMDDLTLSQVIKWFEQQAKQRLENR